MATMDEFDPDAISRRLIERIESGELKQMILQNESKDSVNVEESKESMKASVEQMFED